MSTLDILFSFVWLILASGLAAVIGGAIPKKHRWCMPSVNRCNDCGAAIPDQYEQCTPCLMIALERDLERDGER